MAASEHITKNSAGSSQKSKKIMDDILKSLNLSFDKDMGMLNGSGVRYIPKDISKIIRFRDLIGDLVQVLDDSLTIDKQKEDEKDLSILKKEKKESIAKDSLKENKEPQDVSTKISLLKYRQQKIVEKESKNKNLQKINNDIAKEAIIDSSVDDGVVTEQKEAQLSTTGEKYANDITSQAEQNNENTETVTKLKDPTTLTKKRLSNGKSPMSLENEQKLEISEEIQSKEKDETAEIDENTSTKQDAIKIVNDTEDQDDDDDEDEIHVSKRRKIIIDKDRMENDPLVKNPKSEFVISQTLPKAAALLGLFNEKSGLEATGSEYLKQKYAVASYPTKDLMEMLPGRMPDLDLSTPKPTNQIQFTTWLSYVDPFFRLFTEKDQDFLKEEFVIPQSLSKKMTIRGNNSIVKAGLYNKSAEEYDPEITPFQITKLGPLYSDVWLKEDNFNNIANISLPTLPHPESILPKGSSKLLKEDILDLENQISCGPLASRLISAILKEGEGEVMGEESPFHIKDEEDNGQDKKTANGDNDDQSFYSSTATTPFDDNDLMKQATVPFRWKLDTNDVSQSLEYESFEDKLKQELRYVGIYMNEEDEEIDWVYGREDDEICAELRQLQDQLRSVQKKNAKRKQILKPILDKYLAWQEYQQILEDLDKQVDQVYIKRVRAPKSKKKKHTPVAQSTPHSPSLNGSNNRLNSGEFGTSTSQAAIQAAHQQAANQSLRGLIDKRNKWISQIGPLFGENPELIKRIPKESIFEEDEEVGDSKKNTDDTPENNSNSITSGVEGDEEANGISNDVVKGPVFDQNEA